MRVLHLFCPRCQYDLFASRSERCPECGFAISRRELISQVLARRRTIIATALSLCIPPLIVVAVYLPPILGRALTENRNVRGAMAAAIPSGIMMALILAPFFARRFSRGLLWLIKTTRGRRSYAFEHAALFIIAMAAQTILAVVAVNLLAPLAFANLFFD